VRSALGHNAVLTRPNPSCNQIGAVGAANVGSALEGNSVLTSLDLGWNHIGAVGAASVRSALGHNAVLTSLDLSCNKIGSVGAAIVCSALKGNSVLVELNCSFYHAHACRIDALLERNRTRSLRRVAGHTNALDQVFRNEYIISRMFNYV